MLNSFPWGWRTITNVAGPGWDGHSHSWVPWTSEVPRISSYSSLSTLKELHAGSGKANINATFEQ
jgi:hypothetical protein